MRRGNEEACRRFKTSRVRRRRKGEDTKVGGEKGRGMREGEGEGEEAEEGRVPCCHLDGSLDVFLVGRRRVRKFA